MDIGPTPELAEACRQVLGSDSPAAVIGAIRDEDQTAWNEVQRVHKEILTAKDCSAS